MRRQAIQIGQLLHLAVTNVAPGLMPFLNDRGVASGRETFARVLEGRIPAPGIGTDYAHPLFQQVKRRLTPHADPGLQVTWLAE